MKLFLCTSPQDVNIAERSKYPLCHMAYRIGKDFRLYRSGLGINVKGGTMMLSDYGLDPLCTYSDDLLHDIKRECDVRGFNGVVCDFEHRASPPLQRFITEGAEYLTNLGITIYIHGEYSTTAPRAKVLVSTAITGGSFQESMQQAINKYGENCVVFFEPLCFDFSMSSPGGDTKFLTQEKLSQLIYEQNAVTYFSRELCATYFTYRDAHKRSKFVVYDDDRSIIKKLSVSISLGYAEAFILYDDAKRSIKEISDIIGV